MQLMQLVQLLQADAADAAGAAAASTAASTMRMMCIKIVHWEILSTQRVGELSRTRSSTTRGHVGEGERSLEQCVLESTFL